MLGMVGSGCGLVVSIALGSSGVVRERPALRMALRHHVGREASGPYGTGIAMWGERPVVRVALSSPFVVRERPALRMALRHHVGR